MIMVVNGFGVKFDFDVAVNYMDDDLRNELAAELAPCTDQEFLTPTGKLTEKNLTKFGS